MMAKFQNIETKRPGLPCEIQIMNLSGHDVLTTFDPAQENTVKVAQNDLVDFFDKCIAEFGDKSNLKPAVFGRSVDSPDGELELVNVKSPDFDLSLYRQILVQPVPLTGG